MAAGWKPIWIGPTQPGACKWASVRPLVPDVGDPWLDTGVGALKVCVSKYPYVWETMGGGVGPPGPEGPQGVPGESGAPGAPGPNSISTATDSSITGILKGAAGKVAAASSGTDYETPGAAATVQSNLGTHAALTASIHGSDGSGKYPSTPALAGAEAANANIQGHVTAPHAPAGAQVNADITKAEIEAKLTGAIATHTHAGGADPFIAKLVLGADKPTGANTTPITLGLSFNYEANSKYIIDLYMLVAPAVAGTGCGFLIDASTAVTYVGTFASHQLAITGTLSGGGSIGDLGATSQGVSSGMVGTGSNFVYGGGILITGANTGTATFFFRSETTAVTTCKSGSIVRVMKV